MMSSDIFPGEEIEGCDGNCPDPEPGDVYPHICMGHLIAKAIRGRRRKLRVPRDRTQRYWVVLRAKWRSRLSDDVISIGLQKYEPDVVSILQKYEPGQTDLPDVGPLFDNMER
jgi:hypothetical protein